MKIVIDPGHGASPDTGAEGIKNEEKVIKEVVAELIKLLPQDKVLLTKVINPSSVKDSLVQRCAQAKAFNPDVFISVHANKTEGGQGVEVYARNSTSQVLAAKIENNISKLGFKARGVKDASFYVLNNTITNSVLVELFFVDSPIDCALYDSVGPKKMAEAIAFAISSSPPSNGGASIPATTETEQFICNIKKYCNQKGYNTAAFLAVRLFETGGSLAAGYKAEKPTRAYPAFGILQWTPAGCEPIQKFVGVSEVHNSANQIEAYKKVLGLSRLKQLDLCFKYFDYWEPLIKRKFPQFDKSSIEYQYVVTLSPGAGNNYKDGNQVTANELVNKPRFKLLLKEAEGMLNGTVPVPNDDGAIHTGASANSAHVKRMGSQIVNPNSCNINSPINDNSNQAPVTNNEATKGTKSLEDLLPMSLSFSIPEYPRLIGLRPGDVLILPISATYRDWVVTSVNREFNQGLNKLTIQANRPLKSAAFVQKDLLAQEYKTLEQINNYYWLTDKENTNKLA